MSYLLKQVTIRTNNSNEGIEKINQLWQDISTGKMPVLFDNEGNYHQEIIPVSKYSNYDNNENGMYDLSIMGIDLSFFNVLEEKVSNGFYLKFEETGETIAQATAYAWQRVWEMTATGKLKRIYTEDYESSILPQYSKDNKAHCVLYIAVK